MRAFQSRTGLSLGQRRPVVFILLFVDLLLLLLDAESSVVAFCNLGSWSNRPCGTRAAVGSAKESLLLQLSSSSSSSSSSIPPLYCDTPLRGGRLARCTYSKASNRLPPIQSSSSSNNNDNSEDPSSDQPLLVSATTTTSKDESPLSLLLSREDAVRRMLGRNAPDHNDEFVQRDRRRNTIINIVTSILLVACGVSVAELYVTSLYTPSGFQRLPGMQYIAALGDPNASSSNAGAEQWGLWRQDPGPRGVFLRDYEERFSQEEDNGTMVAPAGWQVDPNDWWLDENGILMERPDFPLPPGRYLVSGGRWVTTGLTVRSDGSWELDDQHTLYEVTHLPCRSARYRPLLGDSSSSSSTASPKSANLANFPVRPGAAMPAIEGCSKQDYSVLLLVGRAI